MKTMFGGTSTIFYFLSVLLLSPLALSDKCHPEDKKILLRIKKELNNPYVLASWDSKTACCGWYCLQCNPITNRVRYLIIKSDEPDYNLSAQIPPSIGDLPYLESILFENFPRLTGPIQPTIAKLKNLTNLFIEKTSVSGPIPPFLSQLKKLELLFLSSNKLTGTIPSSLSQLPNLQSLKLDGNKLTGPIPESFGYFKKPAPDINLSHNQLSGPIPSSLGQLDPERIDFSHNKLEGDASFLFGSKKRTQILDLSRNLLSFDFSKVDFPKKSLIWLNLDHNKIYGKIPVSLTKVEHLQSFNVSYNSLCGEIPKGGELQTRFDESVYFHNKCLCGKPLPPCK